jgi:hypothetical protein
MIMIKLTNELRAQFAQAQKLLLADGWIKTHSICHDGGATGNFGICFRKDGQSIYLNYKTVGTILVILEA